MGCYCLLACGPFTVSMCRGQRPVQGCHDQKPRIMANVLKTKRRSCGPADLIATSKMSKIHFKRAQNSKKFQNAEKYTKCEKNWKHFPDIPIYRPCEPGTVPVPYLYLRILRLYVHNTHSYSWLRAKLVKTIRNYFRFLPRKVQEVPTLYLAHSRPHLPKREGALRVHVRCMPHTEESRASDVWPDISVTHDWPVCIMVCSSLRVHPWMTQTGPK